MTLLTKLEKRFHNFYKPAPKDVQRYCAALKGVGAIIAASSALTVYPWLAVVGLILCAVGEGWEKLTEDKPVPTSPSGEPVETVQDVA